MGSDENRKDEPPVEDGVTTKETSPDKKQEMVEEGFSATPTIKTQPVSNPEEEKADDAVSQVSGATKEELKELTQRAREAKPMVAGENLSQIAEEHHDNEGSMINMPEKEAGGITPKTQAT